MTVSNLDAAKHISAWVAETKQRIEAVVKQSTQTLVSNIQRDIPRDTGFARASIQGSLQEMPAIDSTARPQKGGTYAWTGEAVASVIASAKLGDTIHVGWTAAYVGYLEYGSSQQAPQGFIRINALQWPEIVREASAELKARVEA